MKIVVISESDFTVQGHGVHTAYVEMVNSLRRRDDVEVVVNAWSKADVRHIHTIGAYALLQLLLLPGKKVVSAHIVPESLVGSLIGVRYWLPLARWYLRWFYNRADAIVAVSEDTATTLKKLGVHSRIVVVDNTIDTTRYQPDSNSRQLARQQLNIDAGAWVVVSNGQVQPRKRVDTFIRLARELPNMQFIWVGGIPFKHTAANYQEMKRLMDNAPTNVRFTGVVPLEEVKQYFWAANVFVMPSDQETFGLAIVEAAASGLPVVLRDIHDYDHTFRADAVMCSEDDFVPALVKLRDNPQWRQTMSSRARRLASRYDSVVGSQNLVDLYKRLV